jgi:putative transposase
LTFALAHDEDQSMERSRFSEEQIIGILKEHEAGVSVADLCRKHGVSDASIYKWKAKFGGMDFSEAKLLKTLEDENTQERTHRWIKLGATSTRPVLRPP